MGHGLRTIEIVTRALNISFMTLHDFSATISQHKEKDLEKKVLGRSQTPLFPCIVLVEGHACLAVMRKKANVKCFSYEQLQQAFILASKP